MTLLTPTAWIPFFIVLAISFCMLGVRFFLGPTSLDRIVVLESIILGILSFAAIYGAIIGSNAFFDLILLVSIMGFLSSVAIARYLERGDLFARDKEESHDR